MSAGYNEPTANRDLNTLAPRFRVAVELALKECHTLDIDVVVFEAYRSKELAELYFKRGRTIIPPKYKVTNAPNNLFSWHGYGLAVDIIHRTKEWSVSPEWFKTTADVFKKYGCKWGGDWKQKDLPHIQWGRCRPSPSSMAREIIVQENGLERIWDIVNAS